MISGLARTTFVEMAGGAWPLSSSYCRFAQRLSRRLSFQQSRAACCSFTSSNTWSRIPELPRGSAMPQSGEAGCHDPVIRYVAVQDADVAGELVHVGDKAG